MMKYFLHNVFNYIFRRGQYEYVNIIFRDHNLKDIEKILDPLFKLKCQESDEGILATFTSFQTTLIILYDSNGNFIRMIKETWKLFPFMSSLFDRQNAHVIISETSRKTQA